MRLESGYDDACQKEARELGRQTIAQTGAEFLKEYKRKALEEIYTRQTAAEAATRKKRDAQAQAQLDGGTLANVAPALAVQ
jgi:hypothetical protein